MSLRLPARAIAPVLALAALGGIAASFMVYRTLPSGAESSFDVSAPRATPKPVEKVAAKPKKAAPARNKAKTTPARPKAKPKPAKVAKPRPAARRPAPVRVPAQTKPKGDPVDANGLPLVLSRALARNPVTIVALYDPRAAVDKMALAEARAGAKDVNAGFVAISIRNEGQVRPLAQLLGVVGSPAVLVYERPDKLYVRIEGFTDRETVAQAAANAR